MEKLIRIDEKIKDNGYLGEEDLYYLKNHNELQNHIKSQKLLESIQNYKAVHLTQSHPKEILLKKLLQDNDIDIKEKGSIALSLHDLNSEIKFNSDEIILIDGLEQVIEKTATIEPLEKYTSKVREQYHFRHTIPISLSLLNENNDEWEDKFDEWGSENPERDRIEYSNKRELINHLTLELKKIKESNYKKLQENLKEIIEENNSLERITEIRAKYQKENNYKKIYQKKQQHLITVAIELQKSIDSDALKKQLQEVIERLESQKFSIGVTGIIKAGKSTMMNALLQQDILGTAIRPETANLSTIKKGRHQAIVHFWSQEEWNNIKNTASDEQSQTFIEFSEKLTDFNQYIGNKAKKISIEELDAYTSARKSKGVCNLVKEVELQLPLNFLDTGVSLVDTPGIDDPIVQREIITRDYLTECSAILHLMNAKQSATQKDIEFIGDALLNQGVSSLLVVITRIDTLGSNKNEINKKLESIITHAKKNIEEYLNRRSERNISDIVSRVEFLPLAGKFALQHRIGESEKALKKGYELGDTGILEIENYLNSMLFGKKNQRANLAIKNAKRIIEFTAKGYCKELKEQQKLIGMERGEIDKKLTTIKLNRERLSSQLEEVLLNIEQEEYKIKKDLKNLKASFNQNFDDFRATLIDEISKYIIEKLYEGKKPNEKETKLHIETKLKKFVSETTIWYQQQAQQYLESSIEYIDGEYTKLSLPSNVEIDLKVNKVNEFENFSYDAIMIGFGGAVGFTLGFILGPVGVVGAFLLNWWAGEIIDEWRKEKIEYEVRDKMHAVDLKLKEINHSIHKNMLLELDKYDKSLLSYFIKTVSSPANNLKREIKEKERNLIKLSKELISKEKSDSELKEIISSKILNIEKNLITLEKENNESL